MDEPCEHCCGRTPKTTLVLRLVYAIDYPAEALRYVSDHENEGAAAQGRLPFEPNAAPQEDFCDR